MKNSYDTGNESRPGISNGTTSWPRRLRRSTNTNATRRPRYVSFLYLVALWTLPGLLYSVQIYQLGLRENTPSATFLHSMFHALPVWWFWIPLTTCWWSADNRATVTIGP